MKRIITISLLALLLCTTCIVFVACNDNPKEYMLTDFEPWLNEINVDDVVEFSIKYDSSIDPTIERPIKYTSDKEEIARLLTIWRSVTLTESPNHVMVPGNGVRTHTFYMKDGAKYSFGSSWENGDNWHYTNNTCYLMSDSPHISEDKITREETWRPADSYTKQEYPITDFEPWLKDISVDDVVKIANAHKPMDPEQSKSLYTVDREEIERLIDAWKNIKVKEDPAIDGSTVFIIHVIYMSDGTEYTLSTASSQDCCVYVNMDTLNSYEIEDIPLISEDKVTAIE